MPLDFQQKIGPLPVWAWGIGGGIALYFIRNRTIANAGSTAGSATDPNASPDVSGGVGVGGTPAGWVGTTPPANNNQNAPTIATLDDWARAAEVYLIGRNYDPALVDTSVRNYVSGQSLTAQEWTLIGQAIAGIGPTPVALPATPSPTPVTPIGGVTPPKDGGGNGHKPKPQPKPKPPPVVTPPKPTPTPTPSPAPKPSPGPTPPKQRTYVVKPGDNLTKIGRMFGRTWQQIYNANRNKIHNPNLIYPGQVLVIP